MVIKSCEPELLYILSELFIRCLKESCLPDCWNVTAVVPVYKSVQERCIATNDRPISILPMVSKVFEKLVNNRIADYPF